jgi:hypothetical protein
MQDNVAQGDVGQEAQNAKKPIRKERYILNPKDGRMCFNVCDAPTILKDRGF